MTRNAPVRTDTDEATFERTGSSLWSARSVASGNAARIRGNPRAEHDMRIVSSDRVREMPPPSSFQAPQLKSVSS
jgi:hypothetical protein